MSKGYTLNYFINHFSSVNSKDISSNGVYDVLSPRYGTASVKADALDTFLGGFGVADAVARGVGKFAGFGRSPRARILKALKLRKRNGAL